MQSLSDIIKQMLNIYFFIQSMINLQPTLIGKLVKIRPLLESDFQSSYKVSSDPLLWAQHPQPRRCERDFFKAKFFDGAIACKGGLLFQNLKGETIGGSRYYDYRQSRRDIKIGYTFLARNCWGSTYNHQIKHLMLTHIYQWVDTVNLAVGAKNIRSQTAVKKIGGILLTPQQQVQRGLVTPGSIVFEIKKADFKGLI